MKITYVNKFKKNLNLFYKCDKIEKILKIAKNYLFKYLNFHSYSHHTHFKLT